MAKALYLVVVMDANCLAWRLSNTLGADFVSSTQEALARYGRPEIFNTDQGVHQDFTRLAARG
jgi:putative transposase